MELKSAYSSKYLKHLGSNYRVVDLLGCFPTDVKRLPVVLRLLLENAIRNMKGAERQAAVDALLNWLDRGSSKEEVAFQPGRVLMHDTTSTPALVDIAAMRNALDEAGIDPSLLNPGIPVDVSIDHSLAVEIYARHDAISVNLQHEVRRNKERYGFLRWASRVLSGVKIHPPGTGIMHTINLEQLATVVSKTTHEGETWAVPDMMIGTDSHTPMVNGIGVLGWGVGGLEAQTVMFGMPTMLRIPNVIGVKLIGALPEGSVATDLALTVTNRLREIGVTGEFVEFYGPGVSTLTAGERAVIANMAPEYGATTGYFPVDEQTLTYLRSTGRTEDAISLVEAYTKFTGLWFDPHATPRYTTSVQIDLSVVGMHVAGPRRPQDLLAYGGTSDALKKVGFTPAATHPEIPRYPVAIAAITSCTNTSDPSLLIAAGLVARKARSLGLKVPHWVKTSLAPGSPAAASYLNRAQLIDDLSSVGFGIVGYGCTTCIGNPGPLPDVIREAQANGQCKGVAILSGNRNFPGRVHPDIELSFIMSPAMVVAFGLAGDSECNLQKDPIQITEDGTPVYLRDLWPTRREVAEYQALGSEPEDYKRDFKLASSNPLWHAIDTPDTALFPWDTGSTTLRRPPFAALDAGSQLGSYAAYPLLVVGDDITTDHISPASAIPPDSLVADYLVERGERRNDLNVFASRRGNWEVMLRAAFHNKTLINLLCPSAPVAHTLHVPSGAIKPLWEVSELYKKEGHSVVLLAGERYGMGSSRDWAAKGQRLLGIRAVVAVSFERIHRSNLIGMGILPLQLPTDTSPQSINLQPGDQLQIDAEPSQLRPRSVIQVSVLRRDGSMQELAATAAVETQLEVELLQAGGVIPLILKHTISSQSAAH